MLVCDSPSILVVRKVSIIIENLIINMFDHRSRNISSNLIITKRSINIKRRIFLESSTLLLTILVYLR